MVKNMMEGRKGWDWVRVVLAICLFLSPWVMGFARVTTPAWNAWIVAVALGALAFAALSVFAEWEEWAGAILGLWLIISPWVLGFAANGPAMFSHVVLGVIIAVVSAWTAWDYHQHPRFHA